MTGGGQRPPEPPIRQKNLIRFAAGEHDQAYRFLGAHLREQDGVPGVAFAVWAPRAQRVSVIGDFNGWDGRSHPLRRCATSGIWERFVPGLLPGALYKYEVLGCNGQAVHKADPFAFAAELRPQNASLVWDIQRYEWGDSAWMTSRKTTPWHDRPINVYEVHAGSWRRKSGGNWLTYEELADQLIPHALNLGFTHIELLPVTEYALDASWGYQTMGYFAPTSRYGTPDDFKRFVDRCHQSGLGVLLDWVPGHFPKDEHVLGRFDGGALFEHPDPRRGEQLDWGTYVFDYGRPEVVSFLLSSARFWADVYHADGLRVDAVASMLYLDFSRAPDGWLPNKHGGKENLEAVDFLRRLNTALPAACPGVLTFAEESTAWPGVSRPVCEGGLGFSFKWNMGWMNDVLRFFTLPDEKRPGAHDLLTLPMTYAFSEHFILPFSHDEVVHGKRSMLNKMPGPPEEQVAGLRLLYAFLFAHPGKKLLFMGNEFGGPGEWAEEGQLDWGLLRQPAHAGLLNLVRELGRLYRDHPALNQADADPGCFDWIEAHGGDRGLLAFLRRGRGSRRHLLALFHVRTGCRSCRFGCPEPGAYRVLFDSEDSAFGGGGPTAGTLLTAEPVPAHGQPCSIPLRMAPLSALFLEQKY